MKRKFSTYNIILIVVIIIALGLIFLENASAVTGHATLRPTTSEVNISGYYAVIWSENISTGIVFEDVTALPVNDNNGTANWNNTPTNNESMYWMYLDNDSNLRVDVCINASGDLTTGVDDIALGNETYAGNVTSSNYTSPSNDDETPFTGTLTETVSELWAGNYTYWRFWLDIPSGQAAGVYTNDVYFKVITGTETCT